MIRSSYFSMLVIVCLLAPEFASGQGAPQAIEALTKANVVTQKLTAISYDGQYFAEGDFASRFPQINGKVIASRTDSSKPPSVLIKGTFQEPNKPQATFTFATDGEQAFKVDELNKICLNGKLADAHVAEKDVLFPPKYFGDAFQDEIRTGSPTYEGTMTVDGTECDVVGFVDPRGSRAIRYYIGKKDSILHRVENIIRAPMPGTATPATGKIIFVAKNIDTQVKPNAGMFKLPCPDGFTKKIFEGSFTNAPQNAQGLIAAGRQAPDWDLPTPDGKTLSLKSLRGKVVVMDFWASWCGPCKMAMPGLQKVHEHFKDKPVTIVGVNCRERSAQGEDAAKEFVRQRGLTYTQVMKGDSAAQAYGVSGIPCFYIIGTDGKVLYATSGFQPNLHDYMTQIIEKNLPSASSPAGGVGAPPEKGASSASP